MAEYRADEIVTVREREWKILRLLGKGGYSYLAQSGDNRAVLKQIHHEPCEYYQFEDVTDFICFVLIGIMQSV